jgi:hypothetical protein
MSTDLVGPLPVIMFGDGSRQAYDSPRDTMDIRFAVCRDHHPACDCREAEFAEHHHEFCAERREIEAAFGAVLAGHATWPRWTGDPDASFDVCSCTGCVIARRVRWIRSSSDTEQDRRACREKAGHQ